MAPTATVCPKCGGAMEEGFILDNGYNTRSASSWVEGPPRTGFWGGVKLRGLRRLALRVFRCKSCGFLESYAEENA